MFITDIKTKKICSNCGKNIFQDDLKAATVLGLYCNNCLEIAIILQRDYLNRLSFKERF